MENSMTDPALEYVDMFEAAEEATTTARERSERCRDYFDGYQWTDTEVKALQSRGQAAIVDNVIAGKVNWLIGQEMNSRTDPKAFPRSPQHAQGAEAATDAIRFVCDKQDWSRKRSAVWENMLVEGFGGVEVIHKDTPKGPEVVVNHYPWDRLFYDPHSRRSDFSDANYLGAVIWKDRSELARQYPDARDAFWGDKEADTDTYQDRPAYQTWADTTRDRVRVVMIYRLKDGVWHWAKFTKGAVLDEGESPYVDEDGQSVCPLMLQSAYVDRENRRYGEVIKMLDQQDEINKRRSKLLHMLTSRQTIGVKGAVGSVANLKRELAKPDGHVEISTEAFEDAARVGMRPFEVLQLSDQVMGQFQLLQESKKSLSDMGATEALQGQSDGESGRAVLAKQQGAMQALTPLTDKLRAFTRRVFEAIWMRIRQFWDAPKWVRVTDDERNVRFVGFNQPVTLLEQLQEQPEEVVREFAYRNSLVPNDPRLQQVVGVNNAVEEMDVDIIVEEAPDTVTLEAETFGQLVEIDQARGGVLPIELLVEASPLRSDKKTKILERIEQDKAAQSEAGQMQQQMAAQHAEAELAKLHSEAMENEANAARNMAQARQSEIY